MPASLPDGADGRPGGPLETAGPFNAQALSGEACGARSTAHRSSGSRGPRARVERAASASSTSSIATWSRGLEEILGREASSLGQARLGSRLLGTQAPEGGQGLPGAGPHLRLRRLRWAVSRTLGPLSWVPGSLRGRHSPASQGHRRPHTSCGLPHLLGGGRDRLGVLAVHHPREGGSLETPGEGWAKAPGYSLAHPARPSWPPGPVWVGERWGPSQSVG